MIGSGLKKLAAQYGMTVAHGIAYGSLEGYAAALSEGSGWKSIIFTTRFPDLDKVQAFRAMLDQRDLEKEFRVRSLTLASDKIDIRFLDTIGTMKCIQSFLDWFLPLLGRYGASGADLCAHCGTSVGAGSWLQLEEAVYHVHPGCADRMEERVRQSEEETREADTGSYLQGALGALLGALLGSLVWGLVLTLGYVAAIVGLLIGWLAEKGYRLLHGKNGKGKVFILILAVALGVLAGTALCGVFTIVQMVLMGDLPGAGLSDVPALVSLLFSYPDFLSAVSSDALMGLLFAGLGVFGILRQTSKEVGGAKIRRLS